MRERSSCLSTRRARSATSWRGLPHQAPTPAPAPAPAPAAGTSASGHQSSDHSLPRASLADSSHACELLHKHGFVVAKLPEETVALLGELERKMRKFFNRSNAEKNAYRTPQEGERVLSHPAYLTPSPGWMELYEIRLSLQDPSYRYPPGCRSLAEELFRSLRAYALRWLGAISDHLCGDATRLHGLCARDSGPATLRVIHYDAVPALAAQLREPDLTADELARGRARLMAGFPSHTDSSLLTVAPRGSCSGLGVKDYATQAWLGVEALMRPDECVVFAGDPLAYVSRHHFPACMHRPDGLEMASHAPEKTRLSMPFFLYADDEALLDASTPRRTLRAAGGGALPAVQTPLPVMHFKLNVGGCREGWPWKAEAYYDGLVIGRDSDSFPGMEPT